jgi:hypothetical protein
VLIDRRDLDALGFAEGESVLLKSGTASVTATLAVGPCRRGHVQGYWPELNPLLGRRYDAASGEPDYATSVSIERHAP